MAGCPTVHEHPEFKNVHDESNRAHAQAMARTKQYLTSDVYRSFGERLSGDLAGFMSYPKGHVPQRTYFILCEECKAELLKKTCAFCKTDRHTMNDAVLFYVTDDHSNKKEMRTVNALGKDYKS